MNLFGMEESNFKSRFVSPEEFDSLVGEFESVGINDGDNFIDVNTGISISGKDMKKYKEKVLHDMKTAIIPLHKRLWLQFKYWFKSKIKCI